MKKILFFFDQNLVNMRIARNILEIFSTVFLSLSVSQYLADKLNLKGQRSFWLILGLLASFNSYYARALSYNDVVNAGGYIGFGILLRILNPEAFSISKVIWAMLFGCVVGFQLLIKAPLCLCLYLMLLIITFLTSFKHKYLLFCIALVSGLGVNAIYIWSYGGYNKFSAAVQSGIEWQTKLNYTLSHLLLYHMLVDLLPMILFGIVMYFFMNIKNALVKIFLIALLYFIFFILFFVAGEPIKGYINGLLIATVLSSLLIFRREFEREMTIVLLSLLSIPGLISMGSADSFLMACFTHLVPIFLALGIIYLICAKSKYSNNYLLFPVLILSTAFFIRNQIVKPFGLSQPIYTCTHQVQIAGQTIKFNAREADFFNGLSRILKEKCNYHEGDEILSTEFAPGLIYAEQGISRFHPFYHPYLYSANCYLLSLPRPDSLSKPIILMRGKAKNEVENTYDHMLKCLNDSPLRFNENYHLADSILNPFSADNVYFNSGPMLYFFVPNNYIRMDR